MITRLARAAGVDYVQWRALIRAYVMLDYSALLGAYGPVAAQRAAWHLPLQWLFFGLLGAMPAFVIVLARDPFFAATVMVTATSSLVAVFMLMQATTLVAPDDYAVIGFRPVSSTTYFAARVTGLLTHTAEIAVMTGYPSIVAFVIRSGGSAGVAGAAMLAIGASAVVTVLSIVTLYGWLLQRVNARRLQRYTAAAAVAGLLTVLGANCMAFVAFVDVGTNLSINVTVEQTLPRVASTLLYPAVWFAAYVEVARGAAGTLAWTGCALSVVVTVAVAGTLGGRVSVGYADRVAQATTATAGIAKPDPAWEWLVNERRALTVLVRHLLRTDTALQTGILMQFVMGLVIFVIVSMNVPSDPFLGAGNRTSVRAMFLLFLLPRSLRQAMVTSPSSRASWLFFSTPADRAKLVTGMRDLIAIGVLPLLFAGVAGFFIYEYGHVGHALLDAALLCSASYVTLQIDALFDPRLPFTVPVIDRQGRGLLSGGNWRVFLGCLVVFQVFAASRQLFYRNGWALTGGVLGIAALIVLLDRLTAARLAKKVESAAYFE